jgi:hypothetical protein
VLWCILACVLAQFDRRTSLEQKGYRKFNGTVYHP